MANEEIKKTQNLQWYDQKIQNLQRYNYESTKFTVVQSRKYKIYNNTIDENQNLP